MPFDVLWLDIEYAKEKRYFAFEQNRFEQLPEFVNKMKAENKRITIITDPHIKVDENFFVYSDGTKVQIGTDPDGKIITGAFVRNKFGNQ